MKIEEAILAHAKWKTRLVSYLQKPDGSIDPAELGADDRCELGKWIQGEATGRLTPQELAPLKAAHSRFHRAAVDVVRKANAGSTLGADTLIGLHSEFGQASLGIVNLLKSLAGKIG